MAARFGYDSTDEESDDEQTYFKYQEGVTDLIIKVGKRQFHVNKGVLIVMSPVFLKMMMHDLKEKETGVVELKEKDWRDVEAFLKCIFPNIKFEMTDYVVDKVLPLAHEYQVATLLAECEDYLLKKYFKNKYHFSTNPNTEQLTQFVWYGISFGFECLKKKSIMLLALCKSETFKDLERYKALPSDLQNHILMQRIRAFEYLSDTAYKHNDRLRRDGRLYTTRPYESIDNLVQKVNISLDNIYGKSIWAMNIPFPGNSQW